MSKADQLGTSASFGGARSVSARRAAIGAVTGAPTAGVPDPTELPVNLISQNPDNPREELRDLDSLTQSIRELGLVNAITVASVEAYRRERPEDEDRLDEGTKYLVVDGHRRLEAVRRAGLTTIKVHVDNDRVSSDEALLEAAFVANFHNDEMTDLEQAHALEALVKFYGSQTRAAKRLGLSQATISSKLSLLKLSPELQADLATGKRQVEHVRNLGKLSPDEQAAAADRRAQESQSRVEPSGIQPPPAPVPATSQVPVPAENTDPTKATPPPKNPAHQGPSAEQSPVDTVASPGAAAESAPLRSESSNDAEEVRDTVGEDDVVPPLPWESPATLERLLRRHMTAENLQTLAKLLIQE